MKTLLVHICTVLAVLVVFLSGPGRALAWEGMDEMEKMMMARINQERGVHAGEMAEASGEGAVGLSALTPDERLFESAQSHALDLVAEQYFSKISLGGLSPGDRMLEASYLPARSDEVLGMVMFQRYLSKEDAVSALFNNMIQNEISDEGVPILFGSDVKEIGLSIQPGTIVKAGVRFNYYLAVVDLATEGVSSVEKGMLIDINLHRREEGLSPLAFDLDLYLTAKDALERLMSGYVDNGSFDDIFPEGQSGISKVWITTDEKDDAQVRKEMLGKLLNGEERLGEDARIISGESLVSAGTAVSVSVPTLFEDGNTYYLHALVMAYNDTKPKISRSDVSGILFFDRDLDGLPGEGEQLSSAYLRLSGDNEITGLYSGELGEFSVKLPPGEYRVESQLGSFDLFVQNPREMVLWPLEYVEKNE